MTPHSDSRLPRLQTRLPSQPANKAYHADSTTRSPPPTTPPRHQRPLPPSSTLISNSTYPILILPSNATSTHPSFSNNDTLATLPFPSSPVPYPTNCETASRAICKRLAASTFQHDKWYRFERPSCAIG
ncbi:hypothetical protein ACLMJK_001154 [Lecanora helva]